MLTAPFTELQRRAAHRLVDLLFDDAKKRAARRVYQPLRRPTREGFSDGLPQGPIELDATIDEFSRLILTADTGNRHPRFMGWAMGAGSWAGALGSLAAAAMNVNAFGGAQAATLVETQVLGWLSELIGYHPEALGLLTSGASHANLLGLQLARSQLEDPQSLRVFASSEVHGCVLKALDVLGIPSSSLQIIGVDAAHSIDLVALGRALDDHSGDKIIVATAGSASTGAFDDIGRLATFGQVYDAWLHVDGAFGVFAHDHPSIAPYLAELETADSVAFDLHKWCGAPIGCGALLSRHARQLDRLFSGVAPYIQQTRGGLGGHPTWFQTRGFELSRPFRALPIWFHLRSIGAERVLAAARRNIETADDLRALMRAADDLELLAATRANIVCFRVKRDGLDLDQEDRLQRRLVSELQQRGTAITTIVSIDDRVGIRMAFFHPDTKLSDAEEAVDAMRALTEEVASEI